MRCRRRPDQPTRALLAALALGRRLAVSGVAVATVNPGMAWTPGTAALTPETVPHWRYIWPIVRWVQRRASAGAAARGSRSSVRWRRWSPGRERASSPA